jgi:hypothetical protein
LYRGFAEPPGVAVVCVDCGGSGCKKINVGETDVYTPFTERKRREHVKTVKRSRGSLVVFGVGPTGDGITYEQFLAGKLP